MAKKKLTVFIGSSTEAVPKMDEIAEMIKDKVEVLKWTDTHPKVPMEYFIRYLERMSKSVDAAIFIFSNDDEIKKRGKKVYVTRDNVIFEAGYFMKELGLSNTIIIKYQDAYILSDLNGIEVIDSTHYDVKEKLNEWIIEKIEKKTFRNTQIVTPHAEYGSVHLLKTAKKRIWLDAIFYPVYWNTTTDAYYKNLLEQNPQADIRIFFPSNNLMEHESSIFEGYANILRKNDYTKEILKNKVNEDIRSCKVFKANLNEANKARFQLKECDHILFYPFVLVDNTMLVGHFANSECNAPNGVWLMHEFEPEAIDKYLSKHFEDKELSVEEKALKRYVDEFLYRWKKSKEIKF
jgi:hypothetical protein